MYITKDLLNQINYLSDLYNSLGETYRSKAYFNAYVVLQELYESKTELPETVKELIKYKSIGKAMADHLLEYKKNGFIELYDTYMKDDKVKKIIDLTKIYGFGISGAKKLYEMDIKNIEDVKNAYVNNKIKLTNQQIMGLRYYDDINRKVKREEITKVYNNLKKFEKKNKNIQHIEILGSYRRGKPESKDLDVIVSGKNPTVLKEIIEFLKSEYKYIGTLTEGKKKFMGLFIFDKYVRHVDIIYSTPEEYPTKLNYFTGSKEFNIKMRNIAISQGYKLSDMGFYKSGKLIPLKDEKDIFKILKVPFVKPEDRL